MAHILIISFPNHGIVNPTLELARRLVRVGARITYVTSVSAYRRIVSESPPLDGLSYASLSDGYDDGFTFKLDRESATSTAKIIYNDNLKRYLKQFDEAGAQKISDLARAFKEEGSPITCIIYGMLLSWVADVAHDLRIPSVALWVQPAAVMAVYYHYFNGYDHLMKRLEDDPDCVIELPGLPPLASQDLPNFFTSGSSSGDDEHFNMLPSFKDQIQTFDKEVREFKLKPRVLVNTFEALESDALASVDRVGPIPIGPLIRSDFFDANGEWATSEGSSHYMKWLDSKPASSVVYISFGTLVHPSKKQLDKILNGLFESGRPFLWVIRVPDSGSDSGPEAKIRNLVGGTGQGLVVLWCSQVAVLSHPATGCFLTHCGWNSTLESLVLGVPMVCFPQWTDQTTNGKLVEDVWKTGVRVKVNEEGIMEGGELKRCLEAVMGEEEIKKNAEKWRDLAREVVREGGSSDRNMRAFVEEMGGSNLS
ncbi:hypothetical protein MRB53_027694 [Persea americana]|uniref:Uncharacterized protein n=1 Tax=Persea americana TaxID=3435 RepID=A0ACC2LLU9_PERAE|nr:hypothetical protein MRB53_027694 [Persea americana]